jgi:hypothetical protein
MRNTYTKTFSLSLVVLFGAAQSAAGRQAAPRLDWREFTSEAGGFTVKLPGAPRITHPQMVKGPLTVPRNLHEVTIGSDYKFELDYMDMPAGLEPELALEGGISGLTNPLLAQGGRVLTNVKVARGTCEGREATASLPPRAGKTGFVQGRVFYSGQRYFMLVFIAADDRPAARDVARLFMDSLVIRDGCRAPLAPTAAPTAAPVRRTVAGTPDAATGWRRIEDAEQGFSVLMPGPARLEISQSQAQPFPVFHHEYLNESDAAIYSAEVLGDYPEGFYSGKVSYENQLDINIYAVKKNMQSLGLSYGEPRKLSVGGYPGREYVAANEQAGLRGRVQLYATPRRAYIFIAFIRGARSAASDATLERFFSSVRVSPK